MGNQRVTISVIGSHDCDKKVGEISRNIGKIIAKVGAVLICGGLKGVMEAAARGCHESGGITIGLLPGKDKTDANPYIEIAIPTTIGFARNAMVACSGDVIIALPGSHGTSSEISYAMVYGRPVIDMGGWKREGMVPVKDLTELEKVLRKMIATIKRERNF